MLCYHHWEAEGVQPYLVDPSNLEDQYMTASQVLLTDLKSLASDVEVVHHVGSIEMWQNPNENDDS